MASVGVVHYNSSPHKVSVLQQQTGNNNNNNNNNGDRREIIILRKNAPILPQPKDYNKQEILLTNTARKKQPQPNNRKDVRTAPQPIAVARRNARERNRVKQVNNGFANLRQHIPNFIASAFESSTRGGNKKLSKVETLRMAVEYIRSLEDILGMEDHSESMSSPSSSSLPYQILSPSADEDDLSSTNPTPPPPQHPPQYIRIDPVTNTYQIIPSNHLYDDSENLEPLNMDDHILADPSLIDAASLEFGTSQDLSLLNSDSLSPEMYSEQSLSPHSSVGLDRSDCRNSFGLVFRDGAADGAFIKMEQTGSEVGEVPVISLKTEHELPQQNKGQVMDVMQWWEQQQSPRDHAS